MITPEQSDNIVDRHLHKLWFGNQLYTDLGAYETLDLHVLISGAPRFRLPDSNAAWFAAWNHRVAVSLNQGKRILWMNPIGVTYEVSVIDPYSVELAKTDLSVTNVMDLLYGKA